MKNPIESCAIADWSTPVAAIEALRLQRLVEDGGVLFFPALAFTVAESEQGFLTAACAAPGSKNISCDPATGQVAGSSLSGAHRDALGAMVGRFSSQARHRVERLFPGYVGRLQAARTSFRPVEILGRTSSYRKDDTRLHVDAFASRPNHGERILRVFSNINPDGRPRVWNVGEPFAAFATRFLPVPAPWPGSARLLRALHVTRTRRTLYDHVMLQLHDRAKANLDYQRSADRVRIEFPPGTTWICFTDSVLHAALSGQFLLEQTFHVPVEAMDRPENAPLSILENMMQRALI